MVGQLGRYVAGLCVVLLMNGLAFADDNWPQWRGPGGNGAVAAENLPVTWSETENVVWKTPLPSWSGSTPVIWGDRIFVMSPSKPEVDPATSPEAKAGGPKLLLLCISKKDGSTLWERELDTGNTFHSIHNDSSPSPVTDGSHVYAMTGTGTVAGLTMDGEVLWTRNLQTDLGPFGLNFGYGSSPLLVDGKLIVEVLRGMNTDAPSYLVAIDVLTGKDAWRVERPTNAVRESRDAYTTPALLTQDGKTQIVVLGADVVTGHDLATGAEVWRAGGLNPRNSERNRIVVSPVVANGIVYANSSRKPLMAVRAGGEGDVTGTHVAWTLDKLDGPDVPTPACDGTYLYVVNDRGMIVCLDARTGATVWGPEHTAPGTVSASPLLADGKVYVTNESCLTTVLAAGPAFNKLAANKLPSQGKMLSSIAVSGNRLYVRTPTELYCIGK